MDMGRVYRILVVSGVFLAVIAASLLLWKILLPFLFSYILLFALKPLVNALEQRGVPHTFSVLAVFFGMFGVLVGALVLIVPALVDEFNSIRTNMDVYAVSFRSFLGRLNELIDHYTSALSFLPHGSGGAPLFNIENTLNSFVGFFLRSIPSLLSTVVLYCLVIPFATFFLLLDEQRISKKMIRLVPNRYFEITLNLLYNLNRQFGLIIRGIFIYVIVISSLYSLGLWIIGLHYPIIVGVFAGVSNLIPYAGPIVATVAAFVIVVMTGSPNEMLFSIILVSVIVQLIDNALVQPIVMSKSSNLHPLFVLLLVLLGSTIGGFIGMFVIVPLVSLVQIVVKILYDELKRPSLPDFSLFRDAGSDLHAP
jgi:predicted PurR-regulated permease PerM